VSRAGLEAHISLTLQRGPITGMTEQQLAQALAGEPGWARVEADQVRAALHDLEQDGEITVQRDAAGERYRLLDTGGG
jgi:DNA-binding PadR family transcriptional regulator